MNKLIYTILMILSISTVAVLPGCGGGGGGGGGVSSAGAKLTGTFVDAPVAGLSYTTSSGGSGTTNGLGQFNYVKGDTVTFNAGGITLGSAAPTANLNGTSTVTPVNLAGSGATTNSPVAIAIGQLLAALNEVAQAFTVNSAGTFTIPSGAQAPGLLAVLQSVGTNITTLEAALSSGALQTGLQTVARSVIVPAASAVQANLVQGENTAPFASTVWKGTCSSSNTGCGNGMIYLEPDGIVTGFSTGGNGGNGNLLNGSWTPNTTANGGISVNIIDSSGCTTSFQIGAGATSVTITACHSGSVIALTQISAASALANTIYLGGWYAVPGAPVTGGAYIVIAPDGSINGIGGDGTTITGTCNFATGACTATGSGTSGGTATFTLTSSTTGSGTLTSGSHGTVTLTLSRTGTFIINTGTGSCTSNCGGFSSGGGGGTLTAYTVPLTITDTSGASLVGVQVCVNNVCGNPALNGGTGFTLSGGAGSGNLSISLPTGVNYSVYVPAGQNFGSASCSVTSNGSGITGTAGPLPTATVSCVNGTSSASLPLQLALNATVHWITGGSCFGCSASLTVNVYDSTGTLVGSSGINLANPNNGSATYTGSTSTSVVVTYPSPSTGADTYSVTSTNTSGTPNATCSFNSGGGIGLAVTSPAPIVISCSN